MGNDTEQEDKQNDKLVIKLEDTIHLLQQPKTLLVDQFQYIINPDFCYKSQFPMMEKLNLFHIGLDQEFIQRFNVKAVLIIDEEEIKLLTKKLNKCLKEVYLYNK